MSEFVGGDFFLKVRDDLLERCVVAPPPEEESPEVAARRAARAEQAACRERLAARGVPAKDIEPIAAGTLQDTPALDAARTFAEGKHCALVLSGPKGCGKTTAAAWLVAQDLPAPPSYGRERPGRPRFLDVSRLARTSRYSDEDMWPLERALLLVIDDLGMEFADEKGSFLATLDGLFNARYASLLYTVITTNLPAKAFRERYGERIVDRVREVGRYIELGNKSLRTPRRTGEP